MPLNSRVAPCGWRCPNRRPAFTGPCGRITIIMVSVDNDAVHVALDFIHVFAIVNESGRISGIAIYGQIGGLLANSSVRCCLTAEMGQ